MFVYPEIRSRERTKGRKKEREKGRERRIRERRGLVTARAEVEEDSVPRGKKKRERGNSGEVPCRRHALILLDRQPPVGFSDSGI